MRTFALPTVLAAPLLAALLPAPAGGTADELTALFAKGDELTRTTDEETSWDLDTMEMQLSGTPMQQDMPEVHGELTRHVVLADHVRAADHGVPSVLARDFERVSGKSRTSVDDPAAGSPIVLETESSSALEDERAVFTREKDGESYGAAWDEGSSGPAELLEGLRARADLAALLPDHAVEKGDAWDVPPAALGAALWPSGDLGLWPHEATRGSFETVPTPVIVASGFASVGQAVGELEGEVHAKYAGIEDEDGTRVARIELHVDVTTRADRSAAYRHALEEIGAPSPLASLSFELDLEGTATLLWDVDHGRALSFEVDGDVVLSTQIAWQDQANGSDLDFTGSFDVSGTTRVRTTCE